MCCGIVYCSNQADCDKMAAELTIAPGQDRQLPKGLKAVPYHAGLGRAERAHATSSAATAPLAFLTAASSAATLSAVVYLIERQPMI